MERGAEIRYTSQSMDLHIYRVSFLTLFSPASQVWYAACPRLCQCHLGGVCEHIAYSPQPTHCHMIGGRMLFRESQWGGGQHGSGLNLSQEQPSLPLRAEPKGVNMEAEQKKRGTECWQILRPCIWTSQRLVLISCCFIKATVGRIFINGNSEVSHKIYIKTGMTLENVHFWLYFSLGLHSALSLPTPLPLKTQSRS